MLREKVGKRVDAADVDFSAYGCLHFWIEDGPGSHCRGDLRVSQNQGVPFLGVAIIRFILGSILGSTYLGKLRLRVYGQGSSG